MTRAVANTQEPHSNHACVMRTRPGNSYLPVFVFATLRYLMEKERKNSAFFVIYLLLVVFPVGAFVFLIYSLTPSRDPPKDATARYSPAQTRLQSSQKLQPSDIDFADCSSISYMRLDVPVFGSHWAFCWSGECWDVEEHLPDPTKDALESFYNITGLSEFTQEEFSALTGDPSCERRR